MKVLKAIINTVINILIVLVLITSVLIAVMALTSKANGIATVFGYTFQPILTDSMKGGSDEYPGGNFEKGDLIIGKSTGFDSDADYQVGDIVTYLGEISGYDGEQLICHRIVEKVKPDMDADAYVYQTKGDNNDIADQSADDEYLPASSIGAVFYTDDYQGKIIPKIGSFLSFIQTQTGFFLVVLLPMIIFFLYEMIRVVINAVNYKNDKAKEEMEETEEEKQAAIDAAVAAALKKQAEENAPSPEESDAPAASDTPEMTPEELEQFRQFQAFQKMQKAAEEQGKEE